MTPLLLTHGLIVIAALLVFAGQIFLIIAAERGRKQDLIRRRPQARHEFNLTFVIPYIHPQQLGAVQQLLRALDNQEYARSRLRILLGCTPETMEDVNDGRLAGVPFDALLYDDDQSDSVEAVRSWLMHRALATGYSDLLVMLLPGDVIKPDFCSHVATMAYQAEVFQGYVTTRDATTILERQQALARRLLNRIEIAGRYHLGLTARLQASGWAIQPNLLERLPYSGNPLEYSLRLLLDGQRVMWAPSVTVFHKLGGGQPFRLFDVVQNCVLGLASRLELLSKVTSPLLSQAFGRPQLVLALEWLVLFRFPAMLAGFVLAMFALADTIAGNTFAPLWLGFLTGMVALHVLAMWTARCRLGDILHSLMWTPVLSLAGIGLLPLMLLNLIVRQSLNAQERLNRQKQPAFARTGSTRLNEAMPSVTSIMNAPVGEQHVLDFITGGQSSRPGEADTPQAEESSAKPGQHPGVTGLLQELEANLRVLPDDLPEDVPYSTPQVAEKVVHISNGAQQVDALLQVHTSYKNGQPRYKMTLAYRNVSFSTQRYRILDQAFYELETKVMGRGLTIVTCGSCGYFYHPTADVSDRLQSNGVCLFGKQGREVDLSTDAVTVMSDACHYHTPLEEREAIVRQWQDSLTFHQQRVI